VEKEKAKRVSEARQGEVTQKIEQPANQFTTWKHKRAGMTFADTIPIWFGIWLTQARMHARKTSNQNRRAGNGFGTHKTGRSIPRHQGKNPCL
jgi:hypothetical protein